MDFIASDSHNSSSSNSGGYTHHFDDRRGIGTGRNRSASVMLTIAMFVVGSVSCVACLNGCDQKQGSNTQQTQKGASNSQQTKTDDGSGFVAVSKDTVETATADGKLPPCCADPGSDAAKNTPNMDRMASSTKSSEDKSSTTDMSSCDTIGMPSRASKFANAASDSETAKIAEDQKPNSPELISKVGSIQVSQDTDINRTIIGRKINLDLNFVNQDGKSINLAKDFAGQTLVVTTIFTSCPSPDKCPRVTADFAEFAREIPESLKDKIHFVLLSFDPAHDTPQVLKLFGQKHGIAFDHTDLVTSDVETIKKLMVSQLEIPIDIDPKTNAIQNHVMMLHIINPDGYVVVERAAQSSAKLATVVEEAIRAATMKFVPPAGGVEDGQVNSNTNPITPGSGG